MARQNPSDREAVRKGFKESVDKVKKDFMGADLSMLAPGGGIKAVGSKLAKPALTAATVGLRRAAKAAGAKRLAEMELKTAKLKAKPMGADVKNAITYGTKSPTPDDKALIGSRKVLAQMRRGG